MTEPPGPGGHRVQPGFADAMPLALEGHDFGAGVRALACFGDGVAALLDRCQMRAEPGEAL